MAGGVRSRGDDRAHAVEVAGGDHFRGDDGAHVVGSAAQQQSAASGASASAAQSQYAANGASAASASGVVASGVSTSGVSTSGGPAGAHGEAAAAPVGSESVAGKEDHLQRAHASVAASSALLGNGAPLKRLES